jgi:diguanylate cyclase (GGDEF)-like protein
MKTSLDGGQLRRPLLPAAAIVALALASSTLTPGGTDWAFFGAAAATAAAVVAVGRFARWERLPAAALLVLPVGCDAVLALLRQAQGGSTSGYGPLAVLPVVWVGLTLRRRDVAVIVVCTAALFSVPIALLGSPLYPHSGWRGTVLWTVVAAVVGLGANRATAAFRRQADLAAARARELDALVATQTAIATSHLDLDGVLATVVTEAQQLTGADAAVVELPDGDDLVYRAASGTVAQHLGLRVARAGSLSGRSFASRQVIVCRDSETDGRVDRDACRRVGARSLVVVPLLHDGEAIGVLKVSSGVPDAFEERQGQLLAGLGTLIASALVRADLMHRLADQAVTDELTGLPNRRGWYAQLDAALARARRAHGSVSVVVLDLDGFKEINDRRGHAAGDRLLRTASARWLAALRQSDVLGRVGGDEFAVLLEGADRGAVEDIVARLEQALAPTHGASAGLAAWDGEEDASALVSRADTRMYDRKRQRRLALR